MTFREKIKEWSGPATAFTAVAALGLTGGYYTANSEVASLERDLSLATNGRGILETVETIERLSDASNNVFRFEQHAQEIAENQQQIDILTEEVATAQLKRDKALSELASSQVSLSEAQNRIQELITELQQELSVSEEFVLSEQTSRSFFAGSQTIGLDEVYSNFVSAITPGGQENLSTGEVQTWRTAHSVCRLTLTSMDAEENEASFLLVCS